MNQTYDAQIELAGMLQKTGQKQESSLDPEIENKISELDSEIADLRSKFIQLSEKSQLKSEVDSLNYEIHNIQLELVQLNKKIRTVNQDLSTQILNLAQSTTYDTNENDDISDTSSDLSITL